MEKKKLSDLGILSGRETGSHLYVKNCLLEEGFHDAEIHDHPTTDEIYLVLAGRVLIEYIEPGSQEVIQIQIDSQEMFTVFQGLKHRIANVLEPSHVLIIKTSDPKDEGGQHYRRV